ncbi:MAG: hypothetical protein FWH55_00500 [Oscillospiraceae bacterium]|nr:hypothetical protein [Oscillospiraceae bacterium]
MKIRLLIATADKDYTDHLSSTLSKRYADTIELNVCSSIERLKDLTSANRYDAALIEPDFTSGVNPGSIQAPFVLIDELEQSVEGGGLKSIRKYQRISSIAGQVLEGCAEAGKGAGGAGAYKAQITAVWSPTGGVGKTTIALAYAADRASSGKMTMYLNLENFSSTSVYFPESGRSISKALEKLESNLRLFLMGIRQQDSGSGILYFCGPENYDDIRILTEEDVEKLIDACAAEIDELVVDLSSQIDQRVVKTFSMADKVLLIADPSNSSQAKINQFICQHNVFGQIQPKAILVNNKGARSAEERIHKTIMLPLVQTTDPISVFKTLSGSRADW